MSLPVFVFLLVVCLLLSLARLGRLDWFPLRPSSARGRAKHTALRRLLKPRTPLDCPSCRFTSPPSSSVRPAPVLVRPWSEVKSRRGAPTRVNTEGFACPNPPCPYFGITDDRIHALVGDGKHGRAEQIQTFRCQACRTTFQPVEKCVTELTGGAMSVTGRGFLRVEILVKEEKEEANGKRGEAEVDKEGKRRCNGDKEEQAS